MGDRIERQRSDTNGNCHPAMRECTAVGEATAKANPTWKVVHQAAASNGTVEAPLPRLPPAAKVGSRRKRTARHTAAANEVGKPAPAGKAADYSMMFYLGNQTGDQIDPYVGRHFYGLQQVGTARVQVLAMYAEEQALNLYQVKDGSMELVKSLPGACFSDPRSLTALLEAGMAVPAHRYALFMCDHGFGDGGIMYTQRKGDNGKVVRAVMSNIDAADAIASVQKSSGKNLSLAVFDACLMGSIEAISEYALRKTAPFVVTSESTTSIPGGIPLTKIAGKIAKASASSKFTAGDAGALLVDGTKKISTADLTLLKLDTPVLTDLLARLADFTKALLAYLDKGPKAVARVLEVVNESSDDCPDRSMKVDGHRLDLVELLRRLAPVCGKDVKKAAVAALTILQNDSLIMKSECDKTNVVEHGLSIRVGKLSSDYAGGAFAKATGWDEVIAKLSANERGSD